MYILIIPACVLEPVDSPAGYKKAASKHSALCALLLAPACIRR